MFTDNENAYDNKKIYVHVKFVLVNFLLLVQS